MPRQPCGGGFSTNKQKKIKFGSLLFSFKVRWWIVPETETGGVFMGISQCPSAAGILITAVTETVR